ncbi:MAG: hypothetical protein HY235_27875 [Acidobacteria bacterium]|nr:hypothetical protein [Acidobacteriota bacterium]
MAVISFLANFLAAACAIHFVRRKGSRRLRMLTMSVGLMSLVQTAATLYALLGVPVLVTVHQILAAGLSFFAIYLLGQETYDRNLTDRRLRLAEHESSVRPLAVPQNQLPAITPRIVSQPAGHGTRRVPEDLIRAHAAAERATHDLLAILQAVTQNAGAKVPAAARLVHR